MQRQEQKQVLRCAQDDSRKNTQRRLGGGRLGPRCYTLPIRFFPRRIKGGAIGVARAGSGTGPKRFFLVIATSVDRVGGLHVVKVAGFMRFKLDSDSPMNGIAGHKLKPSTARTRLGVGRLVVLRHLAYQVFNRLVSSPLNLLSVAGNNKSNGKGRSGSFAALRMTAQKNMQRLSRRWWAGGCKGYAAPRLPGRDGKVCGRG